MYPIDKRWQFIEVEASTTMKKEHLTIFSVITPKLINKNKFKKIIKSFTVIL